MDGNFYGSLLNPDPGVITPLPPQPPFSTVMQASQDQQNNSAFKYPEIIAVSLLCLHLTIRLLRVEPGKSSIKTEFSFHKHFNKAFDTLY